MAPETRPSTTLDRSQIPRRLLRRTLAVALVVVLGVVRIAVCEVLIRRRVVVVGVMVILRVLVDAQLAAQTVKVGPAAVVLQPASNLHLLGLGSAAPHWLDPLDDRGPVVGPTYARLRIHSRARHDPTHQATATTVPV